MKGVVIIMNTFHARIYESDNTFYTGELENLVIPIFDGEYGVQAGHRNEVVAIVPGVLRYREAGGSDRYAAVSEGMMRIENGDVLVLVNSAEHPEEIDENRAELAKEEAREKMLQKKSMQEYVLAEASLQRAMSRLKVKRGTKQ